jgi:hypothetical protein
MAAVKFKQHWPYIETLIFQQFGQKQAEEKGFVLCFRVAYPFARQWRQSPAQKALPFMAPVEAVD